MPTPWFEGFAPVPRHLGRVWIELQALQGDICHFASLRDRERLERAQARADALADVVVTAGYRSLGRERPW